MTDTCAEYHDAGFGLVDRRCNVVPFFFIHSCSPLPLLQWTRMSRHWSNLMPQQLLTSHLCMGVEAGRTLTRQQGNDCQTCEAKADADSNLLHIEIMAGTLKFIRRNV